MAIAPTSPVDWSAWAPDCARAKSFLTSAEGGVGYVKSNLSAGSGQIRDASLWRSLWDSLKGKSFAPAKAAFGSLTGCGWATLAVGLGIAALGYMHMTSSWQKMTYDSAGMGIEPVGNQLTHGIQSACGAFIVAGGLGFGLGWPGILIAAGITSGIELWKMWNGPNNSLRTGTSSFAPANWASNWFNNTGNSVYRA